MEIFTYKNKDYKVDSNGFLLEPKDWDANFSEGIAEQLKIPGGLTDRHWRVIYYIRNAYNTTNSCPLIYSICKDNGLSIQDFKMLFPTGNQRGACKIAGVSFKQEYLQQYLPPQLAKEYEAFDETKIYRIDVRGFLVDPAEWDEFFAINKAIEMKMPKRLTEEHWKVIYYLRNRFKLSQTVPTIFETCEENAIDLGDLEKLFPDGYHRGAVKLAGLRL